MSFLSLCLPQRLSVLTRDPNTAMPRWGELGVFRSLCLVVTPLGSCEGLRKVQGFSWGPLQSSLVLGSQKMSGEGALGQDKGGFGEWTHVQFSLWETLSGCVQSSWRDY